MRILIFNHCLLDRHDHSYNETLGWIDACRGQEIEFRIYTHKDADPSILDECSGSALFPYLPIQNIASDLVSDSQQYFEYLSQKFCGACTALNGEIKYDDVVIIPYANEHEVYGVSQWLRGVPEERRPQLVFIFLHPDLKWKISDDRQSVNGDSSFYRYAARQLAEVLSIDRYFYCSADDNLRQLLSKVFDHPCSLIPMSIPYFDADTVPGSPSDQEWAPAHIGVLGNYRLEKGCEFVADVVEEFCNSRPEKAVFIQVADQQQAENLNSRFGSIRDHQISIFAGQMSQRSYNRRLESLDILLMPYYPHRYALRTSGVFAESVANGLVSIVPANTWMADQLSAGRGAGVVFTDHSKQAISKALIQASDEFPWLKERAMLSRADWRQSQSTPAALAHVLSLVRPGTL